MAGSRVEKLSTIFKRYTGLIKSGAVIENNRPLWYDVYQHFPPAVEPEAVREEPKVTIKNIYYPEDILRSRFTRAYGDSTVVHNFVATSDPSTKSPQAGACELFIGKYLQLAKSKQSNTDGTIDLNDSALFAETEAALRDDYGLKLRRKREGTHK